MVKRKGRHPRNDLDVKRVAALIRKGVAGRFFDGSGLHLFIKAGGSASWVLRITVSGKRRDIGLGGANSVTLADARELARQYRVAVKAGSDPQAEKRKRQAVPTFESVARAVHAEHAASWRNSKHSAQWLSTLEAYAFSEIGNLPVDQIGVPEVLRVLSPIWLTKPETARRVRQRVRTVLDVARAGEHRTGENPVGPVLAKALPRQGGKAVHHAALPYDELPALFVRLQEPEAGGETSRLALQFLILTGTRTSEVLGARRSEIDLENAAWDIPGERMKTGVPHRVPLSDAALAVVHRALELSADPELIFPGARYHRPLSNMVFLMMLRRLGLSITAHGFRSTFRDWTAETTGFPSEVAEMALAHAVAGKVEAAYRRGTLFEKRRKLMEAWAGFVTGATGKVVKMRARGDG